MEQKVSAVWALNTVGGLHSAVWVKRDLKPRDKAPKLFTLERHKEAEHRTHEKANRDLTLEN